MGGLFQYEHDCHKYISCSKDMEATLTSCPPSLLFNPERQLPGTTYQPRRCSSRASPGNRPGDCQRLYLRGGGCLSRRKQLRQVHHLQQGFKCIWILVSPQPSV